jgi:hypothetical protein
MVTKVEFQTLQPGNAYAPAPIPEEHGVTKVSHQDTRAANPLLGLIETVLEEIETKSDSNDSVHIGSLLDTRLRMSQPVTLVIEKDKDFFVAWHEELQEFGYGTDPISAVQDFRNTMAQLYWQLKEDQHRLGADLFEAWKMLSTLVYEA